MVWVIITVVLNATAQIVLKGASGHTKSFDDALHVWWQFGIALGAYAASVVTWVLALRTLPLSFAYPFMALAFLLVPIASILFFRETINVWQWCFLGLLVIAVAGFALSATPTPTIVNGAAG